MPILPQTGMLEALGWSLLNSWWQFGILWVVYLFLKNVLPARAAVRYNLLLVLLIAGILGSGIQFCWRLYSGTNPESSLLLADGSPIAPDTFLQAKAWINASIPYLSQLYIGWLLVRLWEFCRLYYQTQRILKTGLKKGPVHWRIYLDSMAAGMNIHRSIRFWLSENIDSPMILGWLKPVILIPVSAINQLSTSQLEAILIHELAHIKRNDYLWNLVVVMAEIVFFFNPFTHLLVEAIRAEREHSCDDWVLQFPFQPAEYAGALLQLERHRSGTDTQLQLAAGGSSRAILLTRVKRMLNQPENRQHLGWKTPLLALGAVVLALFTFIQPIQKMAVHIPNEWAASLSLRQAPGNRWLDPPADSGQGNNPTLKNKSASQDQNSPRNATPNLDGQPVLAGGSVSATSLKGPGGDPLNTITAPVRLAKSPAGGAEFMAFTNTVKTSPASDTRIFTLADKVIELPEEAVVSNELPYVPRNSFEAVLLSDTTPLERKQEQIELQLKESVMQARLALEKIDWEKMAAALKAEGRSVEEFRAELEKSLAQLNWQIIQKEAREAVRMAEEHRLIRKLENTLELRKVYEQQEAELSRLHQELEIQQENLRRAIRENQQKMEQMKQPAPRKAVAREKKIVHI